MVAPLIDLIGHNLRACVQTLFACTPVSFFSLLLVLWLVFCLLPIAYCTASPINCTTLRRTAQLLQLLYSHSSLISYLLIRSLVARGAHMHFWLAASKRKASHRTVNRTQSCSRGTQYVRTYINTRILEHYWSIYFSILVSPKLRVWLCTLLLVIWIFLCEYLRKQVFATFSYPWLLCIV